MVFTHLPSNVLLMLVPFMPTIGSAVGVLLARHLISQMDVPTRQSYVNAIVPAAERSAANGITTTIRQVGTALGPLAAGPLMGVPALAGWCFVISGGLKSLYDVIIWRAFGRVKPPEER
jgi:predicted MFS family arabinose efflux permease